MNSDLAILADQTLAILVMDLGYSEAPRYGYDPIRHQLLWDYVVNALPDENVDTLVKVMEKQHEGELKRIASRKNGGG